MEGLFVPKLLFPEEMTVIQLGWHEYDEYDFNERFWIFTSELNHKLIADTKSEPLFGMQPLARICQQPYLQNFTAFRLSRQLIAKILRRIVCYAN